MNLRLALVTQPPLAALAVATFAAWAMSGAHRHARDAGVRGQFAFSGQGIIRVENAAPNGHARHGLQLQMSEGGLRSSAN